MAIEIHEGGGMTITGEHIEVYRLLALRSALELETKGLRFRAGNVYAKVKREFGYRGNRAKVLEQFTRDLTNAGIYHPE
jgi:hypothetical protein